jgi:hypothetical protein
MTLNKNCIKCGELFEKKRNHSKKYWESARYCSKICAKLGKTPSNKGIPKTEAEKLHLHNVLIGRRCNTGRTHIKKGQRLSPNTEFGKKPSYWKGKENPHFAGANNPNWKGGITPEHLKIRWSQKSKIFRDKIFKRDNYTCQHCKRKRKEGDRVILNIHHIKSFSTHKELRFDESNVVTLCVECHRKTDTYGVNTTI